MLKELNKMRINTSAAMGVLLAVAAIASCAESSERDRNAQAPETIKMAETKVEGVAPATPSSGGNGIASEAMKRAADENKHVFIFFFKAEDESTRLARESVAKIVEGIGGAAGFAEVDINNPAEKELVTKYKLISAPMPLVLAFAPNGAMTGGFRAVDISEENLKSAIASRAKQDCMKALQDQKVVILCCQGKKTKFNREAMQGVEEFKADRRYAAYTSIIMIDPADKEEKIFLSQLKIDPDGKDASTALLVPPNMVLGVTNGPTSKESLLKMLASASSGCGSGGCGPSGCAPVEQVRK